MKRVFIGIGSNEGDRLRNVSEAIRLLGASEGIRVAQMATIIETEPIGGPPQDLFLNTVVEINTSLAPHALLVTLKEIERRLGRVPSAERWGPRPIDLDILLYDDVVMQQPDLTIPHPRLHERLFVLEPLAQLAPDIVPPLLMKSAAELLDRAASTASP